MTFLDGFTLFIRIGASLSAIGLIASPAPSIWRIHKDQNTGPMSMIPLVAMFGANFICAFYGIVINQYFPMVITYGIGTLLATVYLSVFLRYTTERRRLILLWLAALLANLLVMAFAYVSLLWLTYSAMENVVGILNSLASCLMYASPFATLKKVFETKNVVYIPIRLVCAGFVVNIFWSTFGFLVLNVYIILPCLLGVVFTVMQMIVYTKYRHSRVAACPSLMVDMLEASTFPAGVASASSKTMVLTPQQLQELKTLTPNKLPDQQQPSIQSPKPKPLELAYITI